MIRRPPRSTRPDTLSLHDALPIARLAARQRRRAHPLRHRARQAGRRLPGLGAADAGHPIERGEAIGSDAMTRTMTGTLYGLGIGPGGPELITVKALRPPKAAPGLAYPAPASGATLTPAIRSEERRVGKECASTVRTRW